MLARGESLTRDLQVEMLDLEWYRQRGYQLTYTTKELLKDKKWCGSFMDGDAPPHVP